MKAFLIDMSLCNGCYNCQLACKDEHVGNEWLPYAFPQPELGHFWMKIQETTHGQVPKVKLEYKPVMCKHCAEAPCIEKHPEYFYRREDGLVILDPEKAQGHDEIMDACPYGTIYWNAELETPQKCTGCAHLVDEGELPHCVDLCYTNALRFGEEEDFGELLNQAETFADDAHGARVYYLNAPGLFIAGDVWDPEIDEALEDVEVMLRCPDGTVLTEKTDDFGDFWFRRLTAGEYDLTVKMEGYQPVEQHVSLEKSLNLKDFPLTRV